MKKAFIIAAIAAASLASYYLFIKPGKNVQAGYMAKISGTWILDSITTAPGRDSLAILPIADSNFANYRYQFLDSVTVYRMLIDRVMDTLSYQYLKNNFTWIKNSDSAFCTVLVHDSSRFVLQTGDSAKLVFRKLAD